MSNFAIRLSVIVTCVIAIILANITSEDGTGSTAELVKLLSFLTIVCVLGMWTVDKLNQRIGQ